MANIKISQLPAATTPVSGTEELPLVQSGVTKKIALSDLSSISFGATGLTPATATSGAVVVAGTLDVNNGGTGLTAGTSGGVLAYTASGTLASSAALAASALVIGGGAGAAPSTTTTGTGVVTALGVNVGTAGAFVVNGGALGSPSSVGTLPAFTLGGTVSGGGNQINNVVIGTTTPLAGAFTTLTASSTATLNTLVSSGATLTGGTINGMTVGATTATTGAFTTLTTSSTVTVNGGTANGVAYLNGSKVLTTGTALTFDGTSLSVNGGRVNALTADVGGTIGGTAQFVTVNTNGAVGDFSGIRFNYYNSGDSGGKFAYIGAVVTSATSNGLADIVFGVKSSTATITISEQMRLTSAGLAVTGTLSATGTLSGGTSGTGYSFSGSAPATSLTLDASGNLLVGTTTLGGVGTTIYSPGGIGRIDLNKSTSGNATGMSFSHNGSQVGSITYSDTATSFNTTSDLRLKENIQDAESASSLIDSLQVRQFDWKEDNTHQRYGFVAQELVTVAPEAVHQPADPEAMMAVDYSKLVPMLVKEIQSLRARVAQLESKS